MGEANINGVAVPFLPIGLVPSGGMDGLKRRDHLPLPEERSFDHVLKQERDGLKFSKHAQERMESRGVQLSQDDVVSLQKAVQQAGSKGAQESLVLLRDMAFIVSVKNQTVVTAIGNDRLKENVFTNIDSAVIAG